MTSRAVSTTASWKERSWTFYPTPCRPAGWYWSASPGNKGRENADVVSRYATVVGGVDVDPAARELAEQMNIPFFATVAEAVTSVHFDVAVVTVPHDAHFEVCVDLLHAGKHIIKEKPFAVSEIDARKIAELAHERERAVFTLVQRRFNPAFDFAEQNLYRIGRPYWFRYDYHMNLSRPTSGWRADARHAAGGVVRDMGYHLADVLVRFFPEPSRVRSTFHYCHEQMRERRLEDLASISFDFDVENFSGVMAVSRHSHHKSEELVVLGTEGVLTATPKEATLHSLGGESLGSTEIGRSKSIMTDQMWHHYLGSLDDQTARQRHVADQLAAVRLIDRIYDTTPVTP